MILNEPKKLLNPKFLKNLQKVSPEEQAHIIKVVSAVEGDDDVDSAITELI